MNEDPRPSLQDILQRRDLTPAEEQSLADWLARHPADAPDWAESARLALALRGMPPAPVPSNFTARVLNEVRRQTPASQTSTHRRPNAWSWLKPQHWIPTASILAAVAVVGWEWHQRSGVAEFARDVAPLRVIASVPAEVLQDFDAIQRFGEAQAPVDFELLAALE